MEEKNENDFISHDKKAFWCRFFSLVTFCLREKTHTCERERACARVCVAKNSTREMLPEIVVKEDAKIVIDDVTNDDDDDDRLNRSSSSHSDCRRDRRHQLAEERREKRREERRANRSQAEKLLVARGSHPGAAGEVHPRNADVNGAEHK